MRRTHLILPLFIFSLILLPVTAQAQMFSVGTTEEVRTDPLGLHSSLSLGWEFADFSYFGDADLDQNDLSFNESIIGFRLESPGLDIGLSFGGRLTGMDENSYLNVTGRLHNIVGLYRRSNAIVGIPIQITTDLKRVQANRSDSEFQQSSFIIGSGIYSALRVSNSFDMTVKATPNYGFSFSQGNLFGGSLFRFDGRTQFIFRNVIGNSDFSFSYHFDYRRYDIDGDQNDYDFMSHSISIGYIF
jgi:hypothetical protein